MAVIPGILGDHDAPGYVLARETTATPSTVPLWGQTGEFTIDVDGMTVRIEQNGIFGIGSSHMFWPGFVAHAVEYDKPFLSETGYRSFIGAQGTVVSGFTPDRYAEEIIRSYIQRECKGKVLRIKQTYVEREMARRAEGQTCREPGR